MTEQLNSTAPGRPRLDAWLMYGGRGTRDAARSILAILIAIYLAQIGFSTTETGVVLGISLAGGVLVSLAVMVTGTRVSRRAWFVSLALLTAITGILLIASENILVLAVGSFFGSYAASGMHVGPIIQLEQAGLAQVSANDRRTRAFTNLSISSSAGRAAGALLVGVATFLINVRDFEPVDAYRFTIGIYVALNFITAGVYAALSSAVEAKREVDAASPTWPNPLQAKARGRILRISALFGVDSFAGGLVFDAFVSFWLFTKFGVNEGTIGGVFVAMQVVNLVSLWLAPYVANRIGLLNTLVWTQFIGNLALIGFAFAPAASVAVLFLIVRALFDEMDVPTRQSYVMAIVPDDERVLMAGTNNLGRAIGRVPSSTVTGVLWSGALTVAPWLLGAGLKLAYDLAVYMSFRAVTPPEERERAARRE
jgi:MFS family permease